MTLPIPQSAIQYLRDVPTFREALRGWAENPDSDECPLGIIASSFDDEEDEFTAEEQMSCDKFCGSIFGNAPHRNCPCVRIKRRYYCAFKQADILPTVKEALRLSEVQS